MNQSLCASVVIDSVADHAYKAHLLIKTLNDLGGIGYRQIRVHHTAAVSRETVRDFASLGCVTREIDRFLDGKHCNKVAQLALFDTCYLEGLAGVLLFDADVAVAQPINLPDSSCVCGKVVDSANPPFAVLKRVFEAFGLTLPRLVPTDWGNGATLCTNLNGGFIYIPAKSVPAVARTWMTYAHSLFERRSLFDSEEQAGHIDQVSLALTLADLALPLKLLPANFNFPVHSVLEPLSLDSGQAVVAAHYHNDLDAAGRIIPKIALPAVTSAVQRINALASQISPAAYQTFVAGRAKRREIRPVPPDILVEGIRSWETSFSHRPKIVFHAGTPKSGTTSLQHWLEAHRAELNRRGLWYPETFATPVPKHQFLVSQLLSGGGEGFAEAILDALSATTRETRIVLFSTEGIYNHWRDFSATGLSMLRFLASRFAVEFLVCFRDPSEFAVSLYKQNLRNPPVHRCYATARSFEEMLGDPWFASHLDYAGFLQEVACCLVRGEVSIFDYSRHVIRDIGKHLGVGDLSDPGDQHNVSLGGLGADLLRSMNKHHLEREVRTEIIKRIEGIDEMVGPTPLDMSASARRQLSELTARPRELLQELKNMPSGEMRIGEVVVRHRSS